MKKIALMIAALGTALAFTACQDSADDHPVLGTTAGQTVDFLNTPEMAGATVQITNENKEQNILMTCTQPKEYGFTAPVIYTVEVALDADFTTPVVEGCPASVVLPTTFSNPEDINPSYSEIAQAMRDMLNIELPDQLPSPYYKLYIRLISNVSNTSGQPYPNTKLVSNTVSIDKVSVAYMDVVEPGMSSGIYLRGSMNGWGTPSDYEFVTTSEPGVYEITEVTIEANNEFKIADANWDAINYGSSDTPFTLNEPYVLQLGGGNIVMPEDFTGRVQLTVANGTYTVVFEVPEPIIPGQPTGIFIRGDFNGWGADANSEFLTTDTKDVISISNVTITEGTFKIADSSWSTVNYGSNGEPLVIGEEYKLLYNGGNIALDEPFVGSATLTIKGDEYYLNLQPVE